MTKVTYLTSEVQSSFPSLGRRRGGQKRTPVYQLPACPSESQTSEIHRYLKTQSHSVNGYTNKNNVSSTCSKNFEVCLSSVNLNYTIMRYLMLRSTARIQTELKKKKSYQTTNNKDDTSNNDTGNLYSAHLHIEWMHGALYYSASNI